MGEKQRTVHKITAQETEFLYLFRQLSEPEKTTYLNDLRCLAKNQADVVADPAQGS